MSRFVVVVLLVVLVAACDLGPDAGVLVESGDDESIPVLDLFVQPVTDAPDPADRAGAAADQIECTYGIYEGGWSSDFGMAGSPQPDPDGALLEFVDSGLFSLPRGVYVAVGRDQGRRLYTYSVDGEPKVAVIVADSVSISLDGEQGWVFETFASCDPAEYDASADANIPLDIWLDADDNRVPTSIVTSSQGPEHCDWESVTFLRFQDRQYLGDPQGALSDFVVASFEGDGELPDDAVETGYHHDGRQLWMSPDGEVAYIVDGDNVEAWPAATEMIGCA